MRRIVFVGALTLALSGCAFVGRASQPSGNPPPVESNGESGKPTISENGRFVAFDSVASNLVDGDTNAVRDVFVHDFVTHTTTRVSVGSAGEQATGPSRNPTISDDGSKVAFETHDPALAAGDGDTVTDVVVRDLALGTTTLASVDAAGSSFVEPASNPVISGNGSVVAFEVAVPFETFCCVSVPTVRDLDAAVTTTITAYVQPALAGGLSLSDDGSRIAFGGVTPIFGTNDGSFSAQVVDVETQGLVGFITAGAFTHQSRGYFLVTLSGDGTKVAAFVTTSPDSIGDVWIRDVDSMIGPNDFSATIRHARSLTLSDDGRTLLAGGETDRGQHVAWVREPGATEFRTVSTNGIGELSEAVDGEDLSGDGRWLAFGVSGAGMLPTDTNGVRDVYLRSVAFALVGPTA